MTSREHRCIPIGQWNLTTTNREDGTRLMAVVSRALAIVDNDDTSAIANLVALPQHMSVRQLFDTISASALILQKALERFPYDVCEPSEGLIQELIESVAYLVDFLDTTDHTDTDGEGEA